MNKNRIEGKVRLVLVCFGLAIVFCGCNRQVSNMDASIPASSSLNVSTLGTESSLSTEPSLSAEPSHSTEAPFFLMNMDAQEQWAKFLSSYDQDGSMSEAWDNSGTSDVSSDYYFVYGCYTKEMVDKLDAIIKSCNLAPLTGLMIVQAEEEPDLLARLQIPGVIQDGVMADVEYGGGYYYHEGTFTIPVDVTLKNSVSSGADTIHTDYRYSKRNYFDPAVLPLETFEEEDYREYTRKSGDKVWLAQGEVCSLIFSQQENGYVSVVVREENMSQEDLEQLSELFCFSISPEPLITQKWEDKPEFCPIIQRYLDKKYYPQEPTYCYSDVNWDGIEELIVRSINEEGKQYFDLYAQVEGKAIQLNLIPIHYICVENIFENYVETATQVRHTFYEVRGDGLSQVDQLTFNKQTQHWIRSADTSWQAEQLEITKEDAQFLLNQYNRLQFALFYPQKCSQHLKK